MFSVVLHPAPDQAISFGACPQPTAAVKTTAWLRYYRTVPKQASGLDGIIPQNVNDSAHPTSGTKGDDVRFIQRAPWSYSATKASLPGIRCRRLWSSPTPDETQSILTAFFCHCLTENHYDRGERALGEGIQNFKEGRPTP